MVRSQHQKERKHPRQSSWPLASDMSQTAAALGGVFMSVTGSLSRHYLPCSDCSPGVTAWDSDPQGPLWKSRLLKWCKSTLPTHTNCVLKADLSACGQTRGRGPVSGLWSLVHTPGEDIGTLPPLPPFPSSSLFNLFPSWPAQKLSGFAPPRSLPGNTTL